MIKKINKILAFIALVSVMEGCNNPVPQSGDGWYTVQDMLGREVKIPKKVDRIVGLRAGALRLLVYMDVVDKIAGIEENEKSCRTPYMKAHPELSALPSIGPSMGGDAELIMKAKPDVIFITYTTKGDADALQEKTGIPVIAIECPEFGTARDTLFASLDIIGVVMSRISRADSLIDYIKNSIIDLEKLTTATANSEKPSVYVGGVPYSGAHGINSTQPYYPPFMFTHSLNVASEINKRLISHVKGTYIDKEQLLLWNPELIFIDESGLSLSKTDLAKGTVLYSRLRAIQNQNIYTLLPYNNYAINYELVLANAWYVGKILYPQQFKDIEISEKTNEILQMFLGKGIYEELIANSKAFKKINKADF